MMNLQADTASYVWQHGVPHVGICAGHKLRAMPTRLACLTCRFDIQEQLAVSDIPNKNPMLKLAELLKQPCQSIKICW